MNKTPGSDNDSLEGERFRGKVKKLYKYCTNCGKKGHEYKECNDAITSYGIITIKLDSQFKNLTDNLNKIIEEDIQNQNIIQTKDAQDIHGNDMKDVQLFALLKNQIKFLMISRKHTLGFIEFIRGRYKTENIDGIIFLFQQMRKSEITKIGTNTFDELWEEFWGNSDKKKLLYNEYEQSKGKFNELKNNQKELGLDFYVKNVSPTWDQSEWGFPKGRRNKNETNLECAMREFEEESGYKKEDYEIIKGISPLMEDFIGTNGIRYKHIYYIAVTKSIKVPKIDPANLHQNGEIGGITYFTYDECIQVIRPYHIERKKLVMKLYTYLINKLIAHIGDS